MTYPIGYGPAEHRRALDALLADMATHGASHGNKRAAPKRDDARASAPPELIATEQITTISTAGRCSVEICLNPESVARA